MSNRPRPRARRKVKQQAADEKGSNRFFAILGFSTLAILVLLYIVYAGL